MFKFCLNLFKKSNFLENNRNVVNFRKTFFRQYEVPDISNWDVGKGEDFNAMFYGARVEYHLNNWNLSSALDISYMFSLGTLQQDISMWDINASNVNVLNTFRSTIGLTCDLEQKIATAWSMNDIQSNYLKTCSPTHSPTVSPTKNPTVSPTPNPTTSPTMSPTDILQLIAGQEKVDTSAIVEVTATFFGCMFILVVLIMGVTLFARDLKKTDLYVNRDDLCKDEYKKTDEKAVPPSYKETVKKNPATSTSIVF